MDKAKLSAYIKSLAAKKTIAELSRLSGIDAQALRSWARKSSLPSEENFKLLAQYVGIPPEELQIQLSKKAIRERAGDYVVASADQAMSALSDLPIAEKLKLAKLLLDQAVTV